MGLKPPVPRHPQLFQRRQGTKAHVEVHSCTDTELDAVAVQVHHSNLLQYKSALFHPRETKQVPRGNGADLPQECFKGWISQPLHFYLVLPIIFHFSLSACLSAGVSAFHVQRHPCLHRHWGLECKACTPHTGTGARPPALPGQAHRSQRGPWPLLCISPAGWGRSLASTLFPSVTARSSAGANTTVVARANMTPE